MQYILYKQLCTKAAHNLLCIYVHFLDFMYLILEDETVATFMKNTLSC